MKIIRKYYPLVFLLAVFFSFDALLSINVIDGFFQSILGAVLGVSIGVVIYLLQKKNNKHKKGIIPNQGSSIFIDVLPYVFIGMVIGMFSISVLNEEIQKELQSSYVVIAKVSSESRRITKSAPVKYINLESKIGNLKFKPSKEFNFVKGNEVKVHIKSGFLGLEYIYKVEKNDN